MSGHQMAATSLPPPWHPASMWTTGIKSGGEPTSLVWAVEVCNNILWTACSISGLCCRLRDNAVLVPDSSGTVEASVCAWLQPVVGSYLPYHATYSNTRQQTQRVTLVGVPFRGAACPEAMLETKIQPSVCPIWLQECLGESLNSCSKAFEAYKVME